MRLRVRVRVRVRVARLKAWWSSEFCRSFSVQSCRGVLEQMRTPGSECCSWKKRVYLKRRELSSTPTITTQQLESRTANQTTLSAPSAPARPLEDGISR